jgi:alanine dehydrogenase
MNDIRYLSREHVRALLPPAEEQLALTASTYASMAEGRVEMPPKPAVHPRTDAFLHAMPAYLVDQDVVGVKWVGGSAANRSRGLPYISGLIVLNDPETGRPTTVMDAAEITSARTAAASGVCIRRFATDGWTQVALIGFGEQGRAHARLLEEMNPDVSLSVYNRSTPDTVEFNGRMKVVDSPTKAVRGASVVVTAIPFEKTPNPIFGRGSVDDPILLLPLDFDTSLDKELVEDAELFLVDDVDQFEYYRSLGHFQGWPEPHDSVGRTLVTEQRADRTVCCNLGVGALDAAFAARVFERAQERDVGIVLPC